MRILTIISCLFFFSTFCRGQNDDMYFISYFLDNYERGKYYESEGIGEDVEYLKLLLKIDSDTIKVVDTLNVLADFNFEDMIHFKQEKFFYFEEKSMHSLGEATHYSILDYSSDSLVMRRFARDLSVKSVMHFPYKKAYRVDVVRMCNEIDIETKELICRDKFFNSCRIKMKEFPEIFLPGICSPFQQQPFYRYKKFKKVDDNFKKTMGYKFPNEMPNAEFQIPNSFTVETSNILTTQINNDTYFLGNSELILEDGSQRECIWSLDKVSGKVDTIMPRNNFTYELNREGDWLYGTVVSVFDENKLKTEDRWADAFFAYELNSKDIASRYSLKNGPVPFLQDKTGKLILLHMPSRKRITIDLADPDSEILAMKENIVYYRIFDEIRRVEIDFISFSVLPDSDKLLCKNANFIPFTHHMFFYNGIKSRPVEEWVE